mgnify:CR=1 FL=1
MDHVSFEVPRGRVVGIVGESGSGKTMLLRAITGILPEGAQRTWSSVSFDGLDGTVQGQGMFFDDVRRHGTGYVHFVRSPHAHAKIVSIDVAPGMPTIKTHRLPLQQVFGDRAVRRMFDRIAHAAQVGAQRVGKDGVVFGKQDVHQKSLTINERGGQSTPNDQLFVMFS